jgi:hypothetical protein
VLVPTEAPTASSERKLTPNLKTMYSVLHSAGPGGWVHHRAMERARPRSRARHQTQGRFVRLPRKPEGQGPCPPIPRTVEDRSMRGTVVTAVRFLRETVPYRIQPTNRNRIRTVTVPYRPYRRGEVLQGFRWLNPFRPASARALIFSRLHSCSAARPASCRRRSIVTSATILGSGANSGANSGICLF